MIPFKLFHQKGFNQLWKIKSTLLFPLNNLGFFWKIFKSKYNLAPQMILSDRSIYMIPPPQGSGSPLFSLFLIRLFGGAQDRWWRGSMLALHILQSQKPDPMEKTSHTIRSRCACAWNFSGWNSHPFLHDSIFILRYGLSFLFFSFLFFSFLFFLCFWAHIYFFFCIAHIFSHDEYEESCQRDGAFLCGWKACFCVTSSVEVSIWVAELVNLDKTTVMRPEVNI